MRRPDRCRFAQDGRCSDQEDSAVLSKTVEQTIAWLCRYRRLLCDFERLVQVGMGWVYAATTLLMVRRLAQ